GVWLGFVAWKRRGTGGEWRGDSAASPRVREPYHCDDFSSSSGRLGTSVESHRYCAVCSRNTRPLTSGPPASKLGLIEPMPSMFAIVKRLVRNAGIVLLMPQCQRSAARRVCTTTRPDEKRPNSASY